MVAFYIVAGLGVVVGVAWMVLAMRNRTNHRDRR
jgi:hypothetical protein